jgi:hypothetical protein
MAEKIPLVQGDTRPSLVCTVRDRNTGEPVSLQSSSAKLKMRQAGGDVVTSEITGVLLPGLDAEDGSISVAPPYDQPGAGGRVMFNWTVDALAEAGDFEAEIEVTFPDNTVQTVYDLMKLKIREQF